MGIILAASRDMRFVRRHPFLIIGLVAFGLFLLVELMPEAARVTSPGRVLMAVVRVIAAPLWAARTIEVMLGMARWPAVLQWLVALPLLFAPYLLLDWILNRFRDRRGPS